MKYLSGANVIVFGLLGAFGTVFGVNNEIQSRIYTNWVGSGILDGGYAPRRILKNKQVQLSIPRWMEASTVSQAQEPKECDLTFFDCLGDDVCSTCFMEMSSKAIDWAGVTQNTNCTTVITTIQKAGSCRTVTNSVKSQELFCKTFHACVYFDDFAPNNNDTPLDCDTLTECNFPGMHASFIGDGVCHASFGNSCYNSAICNFDGGDCCKDTCKTSPGAYLQCGSDGYSCRDPSSSECDPTLSLKCPPSSYKKTSDDDTNEVPVCSADDTLYRLEMYDSFGDGWEQTEMIIQNSNQLDSAPVFKGGLKSGSSGTVFICLSRYPNCYSVSVSGGNWGREASWLLRPYNEGAPAIASGGGSMNCTFNVVGGTTCNNTCNGKSSADPSQDPSYRDFKTMAKCIDDKCMIQVSACRSDLACLACFTENFPDYCFSNENFLAVNDCATCKCTDLANSTIFGSDFCYEKLAPGAIIPTPKGGGKENSPKPCSPGETLSGTTALLDFSKCMDYDKNPMMMTDFDSNNFGHLDTFEACAHAFAASIDHGGNTALGCLDILVSAINEEAKSGEPTSVISQLAKLLYTDGINFCDCAKKASTDCPLCPSFYNFKTLLYESVDACVALDEIDCDAWNDFQKPCQVNLKSKFGTIDFRKKEQCDFIVADCGGAGRFPSFRHLDCQTEIPPMAWDFYNQFNSSCLHGETPVTTPVQAPITPYTKPPSPDQAVKPSIRPKGGGIPTSNSDSQPSNKRPYKSPDKKKSHWFRNSVLILIFLTILYFLYKRQADGFNFVRYRRMTNFNANRGSFGMDDGDMYAGLSLESSTNFEPPSLPPTPMTMPSIGGYGA